MMSGPRLFADNKRTLVGSNQQSTSTTRGKAPISRKELMFNIFHFQDVTGTKS